MGKLKVFIAEHDPLLSSELSSVIGSEPDMEVAGVANDGMSCLTSEKLPSADVLVLNDILSHIDGFSLLQKMHEHGITPSIVVLITTFINDYVQKLAAEQQVDFILPKPVKPEELLAVIRKSKRQQPVSSDSLRDLNSKIKDTLEAIGIPNHLIGFHYIQEAIVLNHDNISIHDSFTNKLFPLIAEKNRTSTLNVMRRMEYAIEAAWDQRYKNTNPIKQRFQTLSPDESSPSLKKFIRFVVNAMILYPQEKN
ncbi:sporulation initiation factor Spo0A C-terminal domain-containing protein [Bacillus sp. ISL-55]|uniref:sporulation initiation factor Spo0A C-terminal domain-containing protein n=1 Tax=Bacillus sp. ISL-55 TaxID=2819134 RepID=UPI001BE5BA02|nr:sporulation initiation factor Spo0A C-terminal domain-containing protein [Bacillus sp. ISL-55]MBT2693632.1 response regulator [Bacillus sp. ISL-55]